MATTTVCYKGEGTGGEGSVSEVRDVIIEVTHYVVTAATRDASV
jgi:hypothetical protein